MAFTHETTFEEYLKGLETVEAEKVDEEKRKLAGLVKSAEVHVRLYYEELHTKEVAIYEDEQRSRKRREERYHHLLEDYYYRSDHIGISWKDAEYDLRRHSAYADLKDADRQRLFHEYMESLARKMGKKLKPAARDDGVASEASDTNGGSAGAAAEEGEEGEVGTATKSGEKSTLEDGEEGEEDEREESSRRKRQDDDERDERDEDRKRRKEKKAKKEKKSRRRSRSEEGEEQDEIDDRKRPRM